MEQHVPSSVLFLLERLDTSPCLHVLSLMDFLLEIFSWSDWEGASLRWFGAVSVLQLQKKLTQSISSQQSYFHWQSGMSLITFLKVQVESHLHYLSNPGRKRSQKACMFKILVMCFPSCFSRDKSACLFLCSMRAKVFPCISFQLCSLSYTFISIYITFVVICGCTSQFIALNYAFSLLRISYEKKGHGSVLK